MIVVFPEPLRPIIAVLLDFANNISIFFKMHLSLSYAKWFGDTVGGVREVKLFNILDKKHEEFVLNQKNIIEKQKQMNMLGQWNTIIDSIMVQFLSTLLYILGANLVFDMKLSVGSVFAFITYSAYVTGPISAILNIGYLLSGIFPSTKRYYPFHTQKKPSAISNHLDIDPFSFHYPFLLPIP